MERIIDPENWTGIFQAHNLTEDETPRAFYLDRVGIQWMIQPENTAAATVDVFAQVFIVSLKGLYAREFRENTGGLNIVAGEHYAGVGLDTASGHLDGFGYFQLNPAYFNIHYHSGVRHIGNATLLNENVTNIRDTIANGKKNLAWKKTLKQGGLGAWTELTDQDIADTTQLYTIILSNATTGSPLFRAINYCFYGTTVAGR